MIKLGDTVNIEQELNAWSGVVKTLHLLRWGGYKERSRNNKYVVFGSVFHNNVCNGCSPVFEGTLADCRKFITQYA